MPPEFVLLNPAYRPEMHGVEPPDRVYAHIAGIDLVRTGERDFFVLEDNVRTPSGVSYVLENREIYDAAVSRCLRRAIASCPLATTPSAIME